MQQKTIAIDIDGVLRNIIPQIDDYLANDHPEKFKTYKESKDVDYYCLNNAFSGDDEAVRKWLYEDRPFEIFAIANRMHPRIIDDLNIFTRTAELNGFRVLIASVQNQRSVTSTLHWLAKFGCKLQYYCFFKSVQEKIDANFDIYIDDCPTVLEAVADKKIDGLPRAIKVPYEFNEHISCPSIDTANGNFDDLYKILEIKKLLKK